MRDDAFPQWAADGRTPGPLIALDGVGYLVGVALAGSFPDFTDRNAFSVSLSGWFAILVVFVLAEVFREGARLRRDAELTI